MSMQPQRVGDHRRGGDVVRAELLAVAGVGVGQAVAGVLDLARGEVLRRRAVQLDASAGVEGEVGGVGHPTRRKRNQSGSVPLPPALGARNPFGAGVGADDEGDVGQAPARMRMRADAYALRPRGAGGVAAWRCARRSSPAPGRRSSRPRTRGSHYGRCPPPTTSWTSVHSMPASARGLGSRRDAVLDEGRPTSPQGCMPASTTATSLPITHLRPSTPPQRRASTSRRRPRRLRPRRAKLRTNSTSMPMESRSGSTPSASCPRMTICSSASLHGDDRVGHEEVGRQRRGLGWWVVVHRPRPHRARPTQRGGLSVVSVTPGTGDQPSWGGKNTVPLAEQRVLSRCGFRPSRVNHPRSRDARGCHRARR